MLILEVKYEKEPGFDAVEACIGVTERLPGS